MGTVVMGLGCKRRRTVSSGVQSTMAVTGTNVMCTESPLQPESEVRLSCRTWDCNVQQGDEITAIVSATKGRTERTDRGSRAEHMHDLAVNQVEQCIVRETFVCQNVKWSARGGHLWAVAETVVTIMSQEGARHTPQLHRSSRTEKIR